MAVLLLCCESEPLFISSSAAKIIVALHCAIVVKVTSSIIRDNCVRVFFMNGKFDVTMIHFNFSVLLNFV